MLPRSYMQAGGLSASPHWSLHQSTQARISHLPQSQSPLWHWVVVSICQRLEWCINTWCHCSGTSLHYPHHLHLRGCGAYVGSACFQLHWARHAAKAHISVKELIPIVIAVGVWDHQWIGKTIMVCSDNTATMAAVNSHTSQHADTAHLLRCLTFVLAKCQCRLIAEHLPGTQLMLCHAITYYSFDHRQLQSQLQFHWLSSSFSW